MPALPFEIPAPRRGLSSALVSRTMRILCLGVSGYLCHPLNQTNFGLVVAVLYRMVTSKSLVCDVILLLALGS